MKSIQACVTRSTSSPEGVTVAYDYVQVYKTLVLACGLSMRGVFEDPKVSKYNKCNQSTNNCITLLMHFQI